MTVQPEKDRKKQDARITIIEMDLRTITGIQIEEIKTSPVNNFFLQLFLHFFINKYL